MRAEESANATCPVLAASGQLDTARAGELPFSFEGLSDEVAYTLVAFDDANHDGKMDADEARAQREHVRLADPVQQVAMPLASSSPSAVSRGAGGAAKSTPMPSLVGAMLLVGVLALARGRRR
ncbi:MAG: DUF2141 domain-containing protein [Halobacteriales archaeon]|nr:DUF2141 domain-containing protein [Halobacteriales archaeon]